MGSRSRRVDAGRCVLGQDRNDWAFTVAPSADRRPSGSSRRDHAAASVHSLRSWPCRRCRCRADSTISFERAGCARADAASSYETRPPIVRDPMAATPMAVRPAKTGVGARRERQGDQGGRRNGGRVAGRRNRRSHTASGAAQEAGVETAGERRGAETAGDGGAPQRRGGETAGERRGAETAGERRPGTNAGERRPENARSRLFEASAGPCTEAERATTPFGDAPSPHVSGLGAP